MIFRSDNRAPEQIRPVNIVPDFISTSVASTLIWDGRRSRHPTHRKERDEWGTRSHFAQDDNLFL